MRSRALPRPAPGGDRPGGGAPWLFDGPAADARRVAGGKDVLPVRLHVDDDPAVGRRRIEGGAEAADMGEAVIGVLTLGIGVMHDHAETAPVAGKRCPLEHFKITIGIAKRRDRATADVTVDADRLASPVVDEVDVGKPQQLWLAAAELEPGL